MRVLRIGFVVVLTAFMFQGCTSLMFRMMGGKKPSPQSHEAIRQYLVDHHADLETAFLIDSSAFRILAMDGFTLPLFQIYESTGQLVYATDGYSAGFRQTILDTIHRLRPTAKESILWDELPKFRSFEGVPVIREQLPRSDYYFVEYWATWCVPCRYQMDALHQLLAQPRNWEATVLTVNCDLREQW